MKNKFKSINNLNIIIGFLKISNQNIVEISTLIEMIKYLYNSMKNNNLVGAYRILFDCNKDSILATVINNKNILSIDNTGNYIKLTDNIDDNKKERIYKKYFVSDEIDNIVKDFVNGGYNIYNKPTTKYNGGVL